MIKIFSSRKIPFTFICLHLHYFIRSYQGPYMATYMESYVMFLNKIFEYFLFIDDFKKYTFIYGTIYVIYECYMFAYINEYLNFGF